jgi:drug/metabolite transporter (DMT)-like permease
VSVISILQLSVLPITLLLSLRIFREKLTKFEWISFAAGFAGFALYVLSRI